MSLLALLAVVCSPSIFVSLSDLRPVIIKNWKSGSVIILAVLFCIIKLANSSDVRMAQLPVAMLLLMVYIRNVFDEMNFLLAEVSDWPIEKKKTVFDTSENEIAVSASSATDSSAPSHSASSAPSTYASSALSTTDSSANNCSTSLLSESRYVHCQEKFSDSSKKDLKTHSFY